MEHDNMSGDRNVTESLSGDVNSTEISNSEEETKNLREKSPYVTVEPMIFFMIVAGGSLAVTIQSFILDILTTNMSSFLNCSSFKCENVTVDKMQHEEIQGVAAKYFMVRSMVETGLQVFYAIFLGGWIERQGCKATMLFPIIGFILTTLSLIILSLVKITHPTMVLLTSIPIGLTGGALAVTISVNTYITRISTEKARSLRIAAVEAAIVLGAPLGLQAGAQVLKWLGFTWVFTLCISLQCMALISCLFVPNDKKKLLPSRAMLPEIFNLNNIKGTSEIFTKTVQGTKPVWIIVLYAIIGLRYLGAIGMSSNLLLYTDLKFGWTSYDYSNYITSDGFCQVAGVTLLSIIGIKLLKLQDATLGICGTISFVAGSLVLAFPSAGWMMYFGSVASMFSSTISMLCRSILSKIVPSNHTGKAFVLVGITESLTTLAASPLFGLIYSNTVHSTPNAVFFVSTTITIIILSLFLYLRLVLPNLHRPYDEHLIVTIDDPTLQN